jgi:pyruvate kinase
MMLAGMNVARFNFSHGNHEEHGARLQMLRALREELNLPVAAMLDTRGPEIRLKTFANGPVQLKTGEMFTLTTEDVPGDEHRCSITCPDLPDDVHPGDAILLDDGLVRLTVLKTTPPEILCRIENDGVMKDHKGVNVPGVRLSMPYMSEQDQADILFGIEQGFDFIAASFVRSAADVREIRRILEEHKSHIRIIAKIENQEGVTNLSEILWAADGLMVARGDMGVEIDFTEIPTLQKKIIARCLEFGKPAITATQMLDSMMDHPRPTRAEITDVANAIYDGTSAIMLSGETAAGRYPVEAVQTMDAIACRTEADPYYARRMERRASSHLHRMSIAAATAHAACTTAGDIRANAIITVSQSGATARLVSRFHPETPIIACLRSGETQRQLALSWGVTPILMPAADNTDLLIDQAIQAAENASLVKPGDLVVLTAGVPVGIPGTTNMIKVHMLGGVLLNGVGVGSCRAVGPVCVCRKISDIAARFHPGDVLVIPYTTDEMNDLLQQAAAIVCEEPGENSHAFRMGTAYGKAVIVGAADATRTLKDGMTVAVDCFHGVVQLLEWKGGEN